MEREEEREVDVEDVDVEDERWLRGVADLRTRLRRKGTKEEERRTETRNSITRSERKRSIRIERGPTVPAR